jgi:hypothetical protein
VAARELPAVGSRWVAKDKTWDRRAVVVTLLSTRPRSPREPAKASEWRIDLDVTNLAELAALGRKPNPKVNLSKAGFYATFEAAP